MASQKILNNSKIVTIPILGDDIVDLSSENDDDDSYDDLFDDENEDNQDHFIA